MVTFSFALIFFLVIKDCVFVSNFTTARRRHVFGELGVATPLLKTFMNHSAECKVNASIVLDGFIQAKRWNDCCLFNYRAKHIFCIALIASSSLLQRFVFLMLCVSQLHRPHLCILPVSRPDWTWLPHPHGYTRTFQKKTTLEAHAGIRWRSAVM